MSFKIFRNGMKHVETNFYQIFFIREFLNSAIFSELGPIGQVGNWGWSGVVTGTYVLYPDVLKELYSLSMQNC